MELMFQPIRKYADFSGRARRKEFWLFALLMFLIEVVGGQLRSMMPWIAKNKLVDKTRN